MEKYIKVNFRDLETKEFLEGTTFYEISHSFQKYFNYPILVAKVDNHLTELNAKLTKKCDIDFYDRSSNTGNSIYACSVQFLMTVALKKLYPDAEVIIQNSIDKGVYCELENLEISKTELKTLENKMKEIHKEHLIYTKVSVDRLDAITFFKKKKQYDKVKVLKYISNTYVNLYRLDDVYDYYFSDMAYSTDAIDSFKLTYIKKNGFVLSWPNIYNPECTLDYVHRPLIASTFSDYTKWGKTVDISNAADLNEVVSMGKYNDIIRLSETHFESQLSMIAEQIYQRRNNIKFVLLAGPSSSGKTTTAKKLEIYLQSKGLKTHTISVDDYFVNKEDTPVDEFGEYDFESIKAIDLNLFNRHLAKLLDGEKVQIPDYNFVTGKREYNKKYLKLEKDDIVVIEGLHAINDELTMAVDRINKFKIFIGPFTQLNIDNHNRIHTSDTRRLRRIVRDNKTRGYNAADTLRMWKKIREGEEKYIFPYQHDVDAVINSALLYELGVLKTYAEPLLFSVEENDEMYPEAIRLINFLRNFLPIPSDEVPKDSILREFIGGSGFERK
jgi:uridine kinase